MRPQRFTERRSIDHISGESSRMSSDGQLEGMVLAPQFSLSKQQVQKLMAMLIVDDSGLSSSVVHQRNNQGSVSNNHPISKLQNHAGIMISSYHVLSVHEDTLRNQWIIDTGATNHVISQLSFFLFYSELLYLLQIKLPNYSKS